MNTLKCAGVALSSILVANCAATAKYEKKSAEAPASNISVELCNEVMRVVKEPKMQEMEMETSITVMSGGDQKDGTPREVTVAQKQPVGGTVDKVECKYLLAGRSILGALETLTEEPTELYVDEAPLALPKIPILQNPPFQFVDYRGSSSGGPDGIADNICDKRSCSPVSSLSPDVQKLVQARYEAVVAYTLRQLSGSVTCGMTGGRCR